MKCRDRDASNSDPDTDIHRDNRRDDPDTGCIGVSEEAFKL